MRTGIAAVIVAASVLGSNFAWSACPTSRWRDCVNLDQVPQISQQIVAGERLAPLPKAAPTAESTPAYTGPTVGAAANLRRAPTVGYRWSLE